MIQPGERSSNAWGTGPLSVGEIARGTPVSRLAVSRHLAVLKEAGLAEAGLHVDEDQRRIDGDALVDADPSNVTSRIASFRRPRRWHHRRQRYRRGQPPLSLR